MNEPIPIAEKTPTIATATWTKLNDVAGQARHGIRIVNLDPTNTFRIAQVHNGDTVPTAATAGLPLAPGSPGGFMEYFGEADPDCDYYAYQASGGDLATLHVQEVKKFA